MTTTVTFPTVTGLGQGFTLTLDADVPQPIARRLALEHLAANRTPVRQCRIDKLDGIGINIAGAILIDCELSGDFSGANARGADFMTCRMPYTTWDGADLTDATLEGCSLTAASFEGATLYQAQLRGCDLRGAGAGAPTVFREVDARRASIRGSATFSDWTGANLLGADVGGLGDLASTVVAMATGSGDEFDREGVLYGAHLWRSLAFQTHELREVEVARFVTALRTRQPRMY